VLAGPRDPEAARARARAHDWDAIAGRLEGLLEAALDSKARGGRVEPAAVAPFAEAVPAA
jgi:hypothetical protein